MRRASWWMGIGCAAVLAAGAAAFAGGRGHMGSQVQTKQVVRSLKGRCHCGAVAYEVHGPIVRCSYCDCRGCQRASGSLKSPYVTVLRSDFRVTAGKPAAYRSDSGEKCDRFGVWRFCRKCGSPLYWDSDNGKECDILAGSLDDPSVFKPEE